MKQKLGEDKHKTSIALRAPEARQPWRLRSGILAATCAVALAGAILALAFTTAPLVAKKRPPATKTVLGQVFDGSDNGISGAAVEMADLTTGKKTAMYTQTGGHFQFSGLNFTDDYQFQANYKGQSSEKRKISSWDRRAEFVVNLHIPPPKE